MGYTNFNEFLASAEEAQRYRNVFDEKLLYGLREDDYKSFLNGHSLGYIVRNARGEVVLDTILPVDSPSIDNERKIAKVLLLALNCYTEDEVNGIQLEPMTEEFAYNQVRYNRQKREELMN